MPLQQLAEESFGGFLITARLDEDIDYITILVYRAPEVLAFTLYLYEDLVQVPCVTETTLPERFSRRAYSGPNFMHHSRTAS